MNELTGERADLRDTLTIHRQLFLATVRGITDEQARLTPTASELCLGGLVKHVCATEEEWARFAVDGADPDGVDWSAIDWSDPPAEVLEHRLQFQLLPEETLAGVLQRYEQVAAATNALVATVDLDARHRLPEAPWFESGASWSARRAFQHVIAETAQHAGHADIIRETIDGQKTMG